MFCISCEKERGSHRHTSFGLQQGIDAETIFFVLFCQVYYFRAEENGRMKYCEMTMRTLGVMIVMITVVPIVRTTDLGAL